MFLSKAFFQGNQFWKYVVGTLLIIIVSTIGQLPLMGAIIYKLKSEGKSFYNIDETQMMSILGKNTTLFFMLLSFAVVFFAMPFITKRLHSQKFKDMLTSRLKLDWKRIFFSFSVWTIFQIIVTIVGYYAAPEDFKWNFEWQPFLILALIAIIMIPLQTSAEEFIFRGYLMQGFGLLAKNKWFPLLLTSILFGSLHYFNPEVEKMGSIIMVYYIGTGLFFGILTLMDEGLELALGFHAANNLITALLVTSEWSALQTHSVLKDVSDPSAGFEIFLPVLVVFPILLYVFAKKYGWTDWKEKLTGKIENPSIVSDVSV
ncbi:CPBP family intramembrane metalloprotease [Flavobacterium amnicola]|uniref:CPBP family intramembrane metalloprotease n=1 Tax=Flavobacterium amnicola TaxID=2506422 RepID=A0A4Q1K2T4_9FLAO|nr:type II CAAX endopeptidase family protein [Flavobacterium amnicola]RXR19037.1 CPBP family intramembrane metalloprotease [Flavobacterium amnicola]